MQYHSRRFSTMRWCKRQTRRRGLWRKLQHNIKNIILLSLPLSVASTRQIITRWRRVVCIRSVLSICCNGQKWPSWFRTWIEGIGTHSFCHWLEDLPTVRESCDTCTATSHACEAWTSRPSCLLQTNSLDFYILTQECERSPLTASSHCLCRGARLQFTRGYRLRTQWLP